MRYYLIAGEASGDLHASNLLRALSDLDAQAIFRGLGGEAMQAAGAELLMHYREVSFMGLGQVVLNLPKILGLFRRCKADILAFRPDVLILIDYSGFNLRLAPWAKAQGLKIVYYIAPQLWATRAGRLEKLRRYVDEVLVILPFEPEFYQRHNFEVNFVGHPLLDHIEGQRPILPPLALEVQDKPLAALLPGSRRQEIKSMLPLMLEASRAFPDLQWVVAGAPAWDWDFYAPFLRDYPEVQWVQGQTYSLLSQSRLALVTSGTATLETALWRVPQVVCYRTGALFYWLVRRLIKVPYIALVNLVLGRMAVPELIQHELNVPNLCAWIDQLKDLNHPQRQAILADYEELAQKLGQGGASRRAAEAVFKLAGKG